MKVCFIIPKELLRNAYAWSSEQGDSFASWYRTMTPKKWWRRSVPRISWSQLCTRPFGNEYKRNWRSGE